MKTKIVILSAFLTPFRSGAEACAEEVPLQLCDQFDFTIITARLRRDLPKEDMLQGKIPVKRIGFGFWFDKWLYPFLAPREAKKFNPKIVHAILETFAGEALMHCKNILPNTKRILTLQTTNRTFRKKKIIQFADVVTAISKYLAGIAADMGRKDVTVIPNGIDYDAIRSACAKYPKVPGRILFVGRLEKMKGVDVLLNAFLKLKIENAKSKITLHVVGDGSQHASLQNLARELGIADYVSFKGYLRAPEVYREYAEAEVFCGLSRSEALGNVFLEAQAAGCSVIATHVGGISETVQHDTTGLLVPPDDIEAVVRQWEILTQTSVRETIARNGTQHAAKYDWKLIANKYAEIYKSFTLSGS